MSDESRAHRAKRKTLVRELLAILAVAVTAWFFWPYPDPDRVLRSLVDELDSQPAVVVTADSAQYATFREEMGKVPTADDHIIYAEPSMGGQQWYVAVPVLSSVEVPDGEAIGGLMQGLVPEQASVWERSWTSATRRAEGLANLARHPSSDAVRELFFGPPDPLRMCIFSPDFEVRDAENPENRLLVSLGCYEVQGWIGGESDWGTIDAAVCGRYLAFAAAEGMTVSAELGAEASPAD